MSKKSFDARVRKHLAAGKVNFTTARYYGTEPVLIITNRVVDIPARDLLVPHHRVRCDKCGALCALHPLTLKQSPEADIICVHCAPSDEGSYTEMRANPEALVEILRHRRRR